MFRSCPICPFYYLCAYGFLVSFHSCPPTPLLPGNFPQVAELFCLNRESQKFLVIYDPQGIVLNSWRLVSESQGYKYSSFFALWLRQLEVWSTMCPKDSNFDTNSALWGFDIFLLDTFFILSFVFPCPIYFYSLISFFLIHVLVFPLKSLPNKPLSCRFRSWGLLLGDQTKNRLHPTGWQYVSCQNISKIQLFCFVFLMIVFPGGYFSWIKMNKDFFPRMSSNLVIFILVKMQWLIIGMRTFSLLGKMP